MNSPATSVLRPIAPSDVPPDPAASVQHVRHMGLQGQAIVILSVVAGVAGLRAAEGFIVPVLFSLVAALALAPIVRRLSRWIPRAVSAAMIVIVVVSMCGATAYSLADEAAAAVAGLPQASRQLRQAVRVATDTRQGHLFTQIQRALSDLERTASESTQPLPAAQKGVMPVQIVESPLDLRSLLWNGSWGLLGIGGQVVVVFFLTYFLLSFGDVFKRKLVKLSGSRLSERRVTLDAIDQITDRVARSLLHLVLTGVVVGVATWVALMWMGVNYAGLFGIAAGLLNAVPYLGPTMVGGAAFSAALLQFSDIGMAALVGGITVAITSLEGFVLTPLLFGRVASVNPVAVLVSALFFGWLWGGAGLLLSLPLLVIIKTIAETVDDLAPLAELLGD